MTDELIQSSPLLVVIGPTASGKSDLAMSLARRLDGEILSVDSMQVYRGMDIGTSKPTRAERQEIVHHLIDAVEPDQTFAVARFVELADAAIASARARRVPLIVTGGTPLYYKALFDGLFEGPAADASLRQRLAATDRQELHQRLLQVDPAAAARIHPNDLKRLVRALEVFELTGKPISSLQTAWAAGEARHAATWIGLSWDQPELHRRINARAKAMMSAGWLEETAQLLSRYGQFSSTAMEATGYREMARHLAGEISRDDALEQIKIATRQLARRQMKWFRRFANVTWLAGNQAAELLAEEAMRIRRARK